MKIIKTKTTEYEVIQVSDAVLKYNLTFKKIRERLEDKCDKCFVCEKNFELEDSMHILFMKNTTNKVACTKCANDIINKMAQE